MYRVIPIMKIGNCSMHTNDSWFTVYNIHIGFILSFVHALMLSVVCGISLIHAVSALVFYEF